MTSDKQKQYYTYMILCEDGSYYTGYSNDPHRRFEQHKSGNGAKYTRSHKPKELIILSKHSTLGLALRHEHVVKKLTHKEKEQLFNECKAEYEDKLRKAIETLTNKEAINE